jgi:hypothetical protein
MVSIASACDQARLYGLTVAGRRRHRRSRRCVRLGVSLITVSDLRFPRPSIIVLTTYQIPLNDD